MSQSRPRGGTPIASMLVAVFLAIIGIVTLNLGITELGPGGGGFEAALPYLSVTIFAFGFVTFSTLRRRRGYGTPYLTPSKVLSVVRCAQCSFKQIKNFAIGEFVFKAIGNCTQCGNPTLFINEIYAEDVKKR